MKTLNFINRKGGVGKTALTANIAYELARAGYLTLIIDLDSQCDITELFLAKQTEANPTASPAPTVRNVLENDCTIEEVCIEVADNLYIVPGCPDLDEFDFRHSQHALKDKLQSAGLGNVDFVLIDNPPSINEAVRCGLVATNYVVVVTEVENPAMNNLQKTYRQLNVIRQKLNPNLITLGIALNKIDLRRNLSSKNIKQIHSQYGDAVFKSWISIDSAIPNSLDQKIPIRELTWRSRTVSQFQRLIKEILLKIEEVENQYEE